MAAARLFRSAADFLSAVTAERRGSVAIFVSLLLIRAISALITWDKLGIEESFRRKKQKNV
jgi:hypothetical protein